MTPRRPAITPDVSSTTTPSPPVRLYKFIALTFLFVTIILLGVIIFMSSKRVAIVIETRAEPVNVTGVVNVGDGEGEISGTVTSTVVQFSKTFEPSGTDKIEGLATGVATIINDSQIAQPLVRTTRLLSTDGVLFHIDKYVIVPANGSIEVGVYADKEGGDFDIGPSDFTIPGLNEAKQKEIYAKSNEAMSGGLATIGVVSADDIRKAEKHVMEKLEELGNASLASSHSDMTGAYKVLSTNLQIDTDPGEEVTSFTVSGEAQVAGIFLSQADLEERTEALLHKRAFGDIEIVTPGNDLATVSIEDFDLGSGEAKLSIFSTGRATLNPDSDQLAKTMFYGKTRDEVRRYALSLDHVRSVNVEFSPAWIRSVPHISDHVTVIVKTVE